MSNVIFRAQNKSRTTGQLVDRNINMKVVITNNLTKDIKIGSDTTVNVGFRYSGGDNFFCTINLPVTTIPAGQTYTFGPVKYSGVQGSQSIVYNTTGYSAEFNNLVFNYTDGTGGGRCAGVYNYYLYWNQTNTTVGSGTLSATASNVNFNTHSVLLSSSMTIRNPIGNNWKVNTPIGMVWEIKINSVG